MARALPALLQRVDRAFLPLRPTLRLPMGAIQAAVIDVLSDGGRPMQPNEVRSLVEQRLDRQVSQDTVTSFLSVASRRPCIPIERLKPRLYVARGD